MRERREREGGKKRRKGRERREREGGGGENEG